MISPTRAFPPVIAWGCYIPRVCIDLTVRDPDVPTVMTQLRAEESQVSGLEVHWITQIEEEGTL